MVFIDDQPYAYVAVITASLGFNGAAALTNLLNAQDLSPNYAGTLYSIINTAGTTAGFVTPLVVAYFTKDSVRTFFLYLSERNALIVISFDMRTELD